MYAGHLDLTVPLVWTVDAALGEAACGGYVRQMRSARDAEVAPVIGRHGVEIDLAVRNNTRVMWDALSCGRTCSIVGGADPPGRLQMTHTRPRIIYLHGDGVLYWAWGWVARVQRDLQAAGFPTFFELFPDSIEARARYWLPFLTDHVRAGEDDVLLGWSCGAVAAMRFAQQRPVRGLVLVAPYYTDLGLDQVRRSGWIDEPWDWAQIKAHAPRIAMFHSDRDPYISQAELAALARFLDARVFQLPGAGHFGEQDSFPELTDYLLREYG